MIVGHPARREGVVPGGFVRAKASHRGGVALWPRPFRKRPMPVWAPLEIGAGTPTPSDPPVRRCELCGIIFRFVIAPLPRSAPWLLLRGAPLWAPGPRHESHPQPSPSYRPVAWRGAPSGGLDMGIDSRRVAVEQPGRCFREAVRLVLVSWVNRVRGLVSCSAAFQKSSRLRLRLRCSDFSHAALRARHTCWRWQWAPLVKQARFIRFRLGQVVTWPAICDCRRRQDATLKSGAIGPGCGPLGAYASHRAVLQTRIRKAASGASVRP